MFEQLCDLRPEDRILDVGAGWGAALERFNNVNPIVALDLNPIEEGWLAAPNVTVNAGGRHGPALRRPRVRRRLLELRHRARSARAPAGVRVRDSSRRQARYFVQTPDRYFPIEPHYQLPLFQFLPERIRRALNRRFTLGWQTKGEWEQIDLFSSNDLRRLFPDAEIHRERFSV